MESLADQQAGAAAGALLLHCAGLAAACQECTEGAAAARAEGGLMDELEHRVSSRCGRSSPWRIKIGCLR